jgi:hypothetical protein
MATAAASRVSDNLLSASDDSFSSSLALISELSLLNLMWSKGGELFEKANNKINKGAWSSNSDHFHEKVVAKSEEFANLPRGEQLLQVLGELQKLTEVAPRDLLTSFDLAEAADDIGMAAVGILRDDKATKFTGNDVATMIEFQMTRIFGGLKVSMEELSPEHQQSLIERIREFLQSLPADQQRFIMDKLGAADLSESVIRQAIASGAMWTAFAAAVQVFGFAFYTTAAHLLAIVSLHLLPFSAYIGLSSTIAVLSSAWMLPIFAGLGMWYYSRKNRGLRKSMAPLIVTSLCLSGMEIQARGSAYRDTVITEALSLWKEARSVRDQKRSVTSIARTVRDQIQGKLTATRNALAEVRVRKVTVIDEGNNLDHELAREVAAATAVIAKGRWGGSLMSAAAKVQEIEAEINRARRERDEKSGLWEKTRAHVNYGFDVLKFNGQLSSAKDALVHQIRSNWSREGAAYPTNTASLLRAIEEKTSESLAADADINHLTAQEREESRKLDQASAELRTAKAQQAVSEQRYYGLGTTKVPTA